MIPTYEEMYAALCKRHGEELQKKLSEAAVAVCGLGGLGSDIAINLARLGVGRLHLIDFDRVDTANLNRQQYFLSQIGMYKTEAMRDIISQISLCTEVKIDTVRLTEENITDILEDENIICEAFDNPDSKAMLVNILSEQFSEKYIIAASGMAGIGSPNLIKTRKITDRFYLCGDGKSDVKTENTLYSPRASLCAAHQALTVLRIIAGETDI